ncbi:hypothetical protein [Collimonas arenae]|nr:hypothetical protein [Collimonas arenae]
MLKEETLFRAFGTHGTTHGFEVRETNPIGPFWGRGVPPKTAEEWRQEYGVLDEWNRNGWLSIVRIPEGVEIPACVSKVSEQFGKDIPGQFLRGGGKQAVIHAFFEDQIVEMVDRLYKAGGGKRTIAMADGKTIEVEVKQSGWSGINGKIGYGETAIPGASMTERLGTTEMQKKIGEEYVKQVAAAAQPKNSAQAKTEVHFRVTLSQ